MSKLFRNISAELLQSGYSIEFQANGQSMYPTIKDGEMITVQPVTTSSIRPGDVVLYCNETGVIAHRIVGVRQQEHMWLLRGDASRTLDEPVSTHQILGKVISTQRGDKKIALDKKAAKIVHVLRARMIQIVQQMIGLTV